MPRAKSETTTAPRRSARVSISRNQVKLEPLDHDDTDTPPAKKQKTRARKSANTATSSKKASQVKEEVTDTALVVVKTENAAEPVNALDTAEPIKVPKKRGRKSKAEAMAAIQAESSSSAGPSATASSSKVKIEQPQASESKAKGKGKAKAEKPGDAKKARLARTRETCPAKIFERYKRAISQRLFMIDRQHTGGGETQKEQFKVLGSTGNVYTVDIGRAPKCDCPDYKMGNRPCKHVIFVFIKVLKVPDESSIWYQTSLTAEEVEVVFAAAPPTPHGSVTVNVQVHKAYLKATGQGGEDEEVITGVDKEIKDEAHGKRLDAVGEDCPVCYEEMTEDDVQGKKLTYDEGLTGCGKPLHTECFNMWAMTARNKGDTLTCVWCRSVWPSAESSTGKGKGKATGAQYSSWGYLNMAATVGISRQRDVSTYHWGHRYLNSD
ncbi:uncharacterized protein I303_103643 [Kwoniella dejecticola CBS 10117]|uniref:SWIM-type domain-containing protein n=1 Tax=Kwoniella dejecticola CBS 10117 TaxID=1296121 RepID=A0A1A6A7B6_9TREE|nr:uncharacterized protein I303_03664 [Kwoniella dejecticola CBS 10117]OBR85949.1 hypothetical protein I303_03664 [Kwoniella dejecticola CBS 10117]